MDRWLFNVLGVISEPAWHYTGQVPVAATGEFDRRVIDKGHANMAKPIKLGAVFPQTEIGTNPADVRKYAIAAEDIGFDYVLAYDHVLGAGKETRPNWDGPYSYEDAFFEPLMLFAHLAACTSKIELATGIIILPQRQTVLVAKQAATLDVLSGGRLRLGIGTGWNYVEYEGLGENFYNRGIRSEEQIEVMRALWCEETLNFNGKWHTINDAGIKPLPVQRSIPVWIGGNHEKVFRRIGEVADGWISTNFGSPDEDGRRIVDRIHGYALKAGRDPETIGLETWVSARDVELGKAASKVHAWQEFGATHIGVVTMGAGYETVSEHIDLIAKFMAEAEMGLG